MALINLTIVISLWYQRGGRVEQDVLVRQLPKKIHEEIKRIAKEEKRSVNKQIIIMLEKGVDNDRV